MNLMVRKEIKRNLWSLATFIMLFWLPFFGAAMFLSVAGIYFKKGGTNLVVEYVKNTLTFLWVPILIGIVVMIFCL